MQTTEQDIGTLREAIEYAKLIDARPVHLDPEPTLYFGAWHDGKSVAQVKHFPQVEPIAYRPEGRSMSRELVDGPVHIPLWLAALGFILAIVGAWQIVELCCLFFI
jgi:hypothetical protein